MSNTVGRDDEQPPDYTLLTTEQVAAKLGVHVNTVYQLYKENDPSKRIPSAMIGKRRRVRTTDLAIWLATQFMF